MLLISTLDIADPPLIANHTQYVETNGHQLRIVHIIHELGSKVPLIVFIHGLGAQVCSTEFFLLLSYPIGPIIHSFALKRLPSGSTK